MAGGTEVYLRWWRERPVFARAYLVELPGAGERALAQRDAGLGAFAQMFEAVAAHARTAEPELAPLNPLAAQLLVRGITDIVAAEVRAGRLDEIEALRDDLIGLVLACIRARA